MNQGAGPADAAHSPAPIWSAEGSIRRIGTPANEWDGRSVAEWREHWGVPVVVALERTTSTNDVARALADAGAPAGSTVLANEQTAGRGRAGRAWVGTPGSSLLLSIVLRPEGGMTNPGVHLIPLLIGAAAARVLEDIAGRTINIKWPNDLLADDRKLAGILCESIAGGPGGDFVVAGIGVNVGQGEVDFPAELRSEATSLRLAGRTSPSRGQVASALLAALRPLIRSTAIVLDPATLGEIARRDALFAREVRIDGHWAGTACGIGPDGALMVRSPTGDLVAYRAGTVRVLDP